MKNMFLLLFVFCYGALTAQNPAIDQANKLIANKRYASAYEVLRGSDPNDQIPEIAIAKSNLLLNFYVKTDRFQAFGLKDIAPNQYLQDFRDNNANVKMLKYKPDSVLNKLIKQYPTDYKLNYALGNFYYEVHLIHSDDSWIVPDSVVVKNIQDNYLKAYNNGEFDYWSMFGLGYTYLLDEEFDKCIPFLEKSVELNPEYPLSYYNLAFAYLEKNEPQKALRLAQKSFELQEIPEFKAETAILIGTIYQKMKDNNKALEYLLMANKMLPNDYHVLLPLMELEMAMNKVDYVKHTNELYLLDPSNPIIYQDLMKIYSENEKDKDFVKFLDDKRNLYRASVPVSANIHFYMAIAQYEIDEWVASKINFEKARSLFRSLYKPDHNVFKVIDSYTEAIKKKK